MTITLSAIGKHKQHLEIERKRLIAAAQEALNLSKRAIFSSHRNDAERKVLDQARISIKLGQSIIKKNPQLAGEGVWRAAMEEFAEAWLFESFLKGKITVPDECKDEPDAILGGLSDCAGEIARYAVLMATEHDAKAVDRAHAVVLEIVELLAALDLTGSLRSKFDQSKQHLRKIEDIRYDLSR